MVVVRKTVREQVYAILKDKILRGEYAQGAPLNIVHLARELDSSNTPVREALSRLESEGLVVAFANARYRVTSFTDKSFADLNYCLRVLSWGAVELCIGDEGRLQTLAELLSERLAAQETGFAEAEAYEYQCITLRFDRAIIQAADNEVLLDVFDNLSDLFLFSIAYVHQREKQESLEQHRQILQAVEQRDFAQLKQLLTQHYNKHL